MKAKNEKAIIETRKSAASKKRNENGDNRRGNLAMKMKKESESNPKRNNGGYREWNAWRSVAENENEN